MQRKNSFVYYYPFLLALYPVLFLYVHNIDRVPLRETLRTGAAVLLATGLLFGLVWLIFRSAGRAALFSAWVLLLFSSFGHVYGALAGKTIFGMANVLAALWAALLILFGWAILRLVRRPEVFGPPLNIFTAVLVALPLLQAGLYVVNNSNGKAQGKSTLADGLAWQGEGTRPPDIYYIILDEYGREDVLREIIGVDNRDFLDGLRARGFYIAEQSHASYPLSHLSIASSLNMDYLSDESLFHEDNLPVMMQLIHNNRTQALLKSLGYRTVTFATGFFPTEIKDSDVYIEPGGYLNSFEVEYLDSTALLLTNGMLFSGRWRAILETPLEQLPQIAGQEPEQPKFVFVHVPAVHTPFVFGPQGEHIFVWNFLTSPDSKAFYRHTYAGQLQYINRVVLATVDGILANAPVRPVIILQGDHGPQSLMDWNDPNKTCLKERYSILNAYYLPEAAQARLYPGISPVNSFRVIFDSLFGADLPLLEDRSYFTYAFKGWKYLDVTDQLETCTGLEE